MLICELRLSFSLEPQVNNQRKRRPMTWWVCKHATWTIFRKIILCGTVSVYPCYAVDFCGFWKGCSTDLYHILSWSQLSFVAQDHKGRIVGYILAKMCVAISLGRYSFVNPCLFELSGRRSWKKAKNLMVMSPRYPYSDLTEDLGWRRSLWFSLVSSTIFFRSPHSDIAAFIRRGNGHRL